MDQQAWNQIYILFSIKNWKNNVKFFVYKQSEAKEDSSPWTWRFQVLGITSCSVWRVRHQWRTGVSAECKQECAQGDRTPAVRRGYVRKWHCSARAGVSHRFRLTHRAHLHASRRRRLHWQDGHSYWLGKVKIRLV